MLTVDWARKPAVLLTAQLALIALCLWAFGEIADAALDPADLAEHDLPVTAWFIGLRTDQINTAMITLTWLGSGWITIPLLIVAGILLPTPENRLRHIGIVSTIVVGVALLVQNIKFLTARPGPTSSRRWSPATDSLFRQAIQHRPSRPTEPSHGLSANAFRVYGLTSGRRP